MSNGPSTRRCKLGYEECVCLAEDGDPNIHGRPRKKCGTCGGSTGLHVIGCPNADTHVVFGPLIPEDK